MTRGEKMYQMFQEKFSEEDWELQTGTERVKKFLNIIEYDNANESVIQMLLIIDSTKMESITQRKVYEKMLERGYKEEWLKHLVVVQKGFRNWKYCDYIQKRIGQSTGIIDLLRMYKLIFQK